MGAFDGERAVVVGAGVAGTAAAVVLIEEGAEGCITDERPADQLELGALAGAGVQVRAGRHDRADLEGATLVISSPGVPPWAPILGWARDAGIPVWGEMELGARLADAPYVAITGTNGKTTTTGMIGACLRAAGLDAVECGNIGRPFPTTAREGHDVLVVEVSSFQLAVQGSLHPRVSVLLNVAEDHLDWHGSPDAYAQAKAAIYRNQTAKDVHVGNRDDISSAISSQAPCPVSWFTLGRPKDGEVGYEEDELVSRLGAGVGLGRVLARRRGYRANAAAAAAAALAVGVSPQDVSAGLAAYEPPPHRGEVVAEISGVTFIDDSKATNVHSALAAIGSVQGAVLIAGGRAKGQDLSLLGAAAGQLSGVVAIGESAGDIVRAFEGRVEVARAGSLDDAVAMAFAMAAGTGCVLLAPACASWDMFTDYVERGNAFASAARRLAEGVDGARV